MKHTKDFRFRCPICDKGFISRVKTLVHLEQAHHYTPAGARMAMGEGHEGQQGNRSIVEVEEADCEHPSNQAKTALHSNDALSADTTAQFDVSKWTAVLKVLKQ